MSTYLNRIIGLLFMLNASLSYSQNNGIDSLKKVLQTQKEDSNRVVTLNILGDSLTEIGDYENAMNYVKQALSLAEELDFVKGKGMAFASMGSIHGLQYDWKKARNNYFEALNYWVASGNRQGIASIYISIAGTFNGEGNSQEGLNNTYNALKLYEELKDKEGISFCYLMIGLHYFEQEDNIEAIKNFQVSLKLQQETGDEYGMAQSNSMIAEIYKRDGNYPEALKKDSAALALYKKLGDQRAVSNLLQMLGEIYEKQGSNALEKGDTTVSKNKLFEAMKNYMASLELSQHATGSKFSLALIYNRLGNVSIKLKNYLAAKNFLEKGWVVSKEINYKEGLRDSYLSLAIMDSIEGNFSQAYDHYKQYVLYRDSLKNDETAKKSLQLRMQYEFDKKQTIAKTEQEKKDMVTRRTRNLQYTAIVAFLVLAAFLFWNNRQKQRSKTKIEKAYSELKSTQAQLIQSEKMASLGELTAGIAHEIQNPLNFVNNFSEVSNELIDEMNIELDKGDVREAKIIADDIKQNLEKINHHGKRADAIVKGMLQHSRSSSGTKQPTNINTLADEYLRLAYHGLRAKDKSFNASMKTDYDESIGNINIIPQDIGRVILNLITNAFYAVDEKKKSGSDGYEPTVTVSTKKLGNKVAISVTDNGNGIPQNIIDKVFQPFFTTKPTGQGTGLGLSIAYDIVKAHGGEIKIETKEAVGSAFMISLPS